MSWSKLKKKWVMVGVITVIVATALIGIGIYNATSNRLNRQLRLGQKYLLEQDYEQAVVEFDKAIQIDPMNVAAYLGKAEAYIQQGNWEMAIDTLETGYELTENDEIKKKLDELQISSETGGEGEGDNAEQQSLEEKEVTLPFNFSDIKILGYDLCEQHFDEIVAASGYSINGQNNMYVERNDDHWRFSYDDDVKEIRMEDGGIAHHAQSDLSYECSLNADSDISGIKLQIYAFDEINSAKDIMEQWCEVPLLPGDNFEDWYEKLGIDSIKDSPFVQIECLDCGDVRYMVYQDNNDILYEEYRCDKCNTLGGDFQFELSVCEFGEYDIINIVGVFQNGTIIWVTYEKIF